MHYCLKDLQCTPAAYCVSGASTGAGTSVGSEANGEVMVRKSRTGFGDHSTFVDGPRRWNGILPLVHTASSTYY